MTLRANQTGPRVLWLITLMYVREKEIITHPDFWLSSVPLEDHSMTLHWWVRGLLGRTWKLHFSRGTLIYIHSGFNSALSIQHLAQAMPAQVSQTVLFRGVTPYMWTTTSTKQARSLLSVGHQNQQKEHSRNSQVSGVEHFSCMHLIACKCL